MAERRNPSDPKGLRSDSKMLRSDPKGLREEVGGQVKKDPRRESTGPSLFIGLLQEVQRDLVTLKARMGDLETLVTEERQARLIAELGPGLPAARRPQTSSEPPPDSKRRRPSGDLEAPMHSKPTRTFRAASTRPPPRPDGKK